MALSVSTRNALAAAAAAAGSWISVHTSDPGTTGAGEAAGVARVQTIWGAPSGGDVVGSQVLSSVGAGGPYNFFGIWSAVTGGTFVAGAALVPAETFAGSGQLRITPTIDG
jgi:hypothetical protein